MSEVQPPLALNVKDVRHRFREIFQAVSVARAQELPLDRPIEQALSKFASEGAATSDPFI